MATTDDILQAYQRDILGRTLLIEKVFNQFRGYANQQFSYIQENMLTKDEFRAAMTQVASKDDLLSFATKVDLAHFATKDDIAHFAIKDDLLVFATKKDLLGFATKDDLVNFATKDDLERFATKDDLANFATTYDLANVATKKDLLRFATKEDLQHVSDEVTGVKAELVSSEARLTDMLRILLERTA